MSEWLSGWKYRIKATIKNTNVDDDLTHFPMALFINAASGISDDDLTAIFTEVGANSQKIAVTKYDGVTQLYVEVDLWDNANNTAVLWVSKDDWTVATAEDTDIYLYFDNSHADNTTYVGITPDDTPTHNVWDSHYVMVQHMNDSTTSTIKDSTVNSNDGTKKAANEPIQADGQIGKAQDFDADDYIRVSDNFNFGQKISAFTWVNMDVTDNQVFFGQYETTLNKRSFILARVAHVFYVALSDNGTYGAGHRKQYDSNIGNLALDTNMLVGFTFDSGTLKLFINGVDIPVFKIFDNPITSVYNSDVDLTIGSQLLNNVPAIMMDGTIDEVRISNIARAAEWIKAEYYTQTDDIIEWGEIEKVFKFAKITFSGDGRLSFSGNKVLLFIKG